jgi:hypothetical protein
MQKFKLKTMLAIFFNKQDLICLQGRKSIVGVIVRLLKRNSRARGHNFEQRRDSWVLLHDNAPSHSAPYPPDLAPAEFSPSYGENCL